MFVDRFDPVVIAECINGLSPEIIDDLKEKALVAARELCWEKRAEKDDHGLSGFRRDREAMNGIVATERLRKIALPRTAVREILQLAGK